MFRTSETPIMAQATLDALLAALTVVPGAALWTTPKVLLFSNDFLVSYDSPLAAFTEADFGGYVAGGIALPALSGPAQVDNGCRVKIGNVTFIADGTIVPPGQSAFGYMIVGSAGVNLLMFEKFAEPVPFANPGDFLDLTILVPEPAFRATT